MKNLKINKITVLLAVVLAVVLGLTVITYAEDIPQIEPSSVISNSNTPNGNTPNGNTPANNNTNKNANSNVNTNANANKSTSSYNNTNLPKTGIEDYSPLFIIAGALVVIAIVAYKKVDYYKNI